MVLTAGSPAYFPPQIRIQDIFEATLHSGSDRFDAELVEEFEGSRPHPSGDHYVRFLRVDVFRHLSWDMVPEIGVIHDFPVLYLP